jgi:hypothetical protein
MTSVFGEWREKNVEIGKRDRSTGSGRSKIIFSSKPSSA